MPEQETIERAREDEREGKSPSTQAGEFVREELEHHPRGETWRAFRQASHRYWIIQGTTSQSETSAAEKRVGQDEETGSSRFTESRVAAQAIANAFARGQKSAQTRTAPGRIASSVIASGAFRHKAADESQSFPSCNTSRAHAQAKPLIRLFTSH